MLSRATIWCRLIKPQKYGHNFIITGDKAKTQAYCDLTKLYEQVEAGQQKNDFDTVETLTKQADALVDKLGPEYSKMLEGLDQVDLATSEGMFGLVLEVFAP